MRIVDGFPLACDEPAERVRVPRRWVVLAAVAWTVVTVYVAQSFLPGNVVRLPGQEGARKASSVVAPQGWAFFTKSVKSPDFVPYRLRAGHWESAARGPHAKPSNSFGLDRASRAQGIEIALLARLDGTRWSDCGSAASVAECLGRTPVSGRIVNPSPAPTLCGRAAVVQVHTVPWAWRDLTPGDFLPDRAAVWEVTCR